MLDYPLALAKTSQLKDNSTGVVFFKISDGNSSYLSPSASRIAAIS